MLDLKYVRENLEAVAAQLNRRALGTFDAAAFKVIDDARRAAITEAEKVKAAKNDLSKQIGALKQAKQNADELMAKSKALTDELAAAEAKANEADEKLYDILKRTPNTPHGSVPDGKSADDNVKAKSWGTLPTFAFAPKPHWELGEALGILDWERAAKITGARFTVYKGLGARLERALIQFMLDTQTTKNGYTEMWTPLMVNSQSLFATGQLPKFEEDLFRLRTEVPQSFLGEAIADGFKDFRRAKEAAKKAKLDAGAMNETAEEMDLKVTFEVIFDYIKRQQDNSNAYYLIPTAEVPITNYHRDETLEASALPIKYAGYTPCFRSEAGAYGKDTRGMVRQHQFNKVELVKFTSPESSFDEHEKLTADAESILEALELPYQRMLLCAGDMGFGATKCYDLEVYSAGQEKKWWECSSCSNFGDFQARRANIKVKTADGKKVLAHTLNGSGLATSRVMPAILENNQQADGSVIIPKVLRPYMGGLERITKA